jgi:hypothetical protein
MSKLTTGGVADTMVWDLPGTTTPKKIEVSNRPVATAFVYKNEESPMRSPNTIFHSPFKNGVKNERFCAPHFMSADVFYPQREISGLAMNYQTNTANALRKNYNKQ